MQSKLRTSVGAILAVGAFALMAVPAGATTVQDASGNQGVPITGSNTAPTTFTSDNGAGVTVSCNSAAVTGNTPPNDTGLQQYIGNQTDNTASVIYPIDKPEFTGCSVVGVGAPATVTTNNDNGHWTIDWMNYHEDANVGAIGVPGDGATISIAAIGCTITVSHHAPDTVVGDDFPESSVVQGPWTNGDVGTASHLSIKNQLEFVDNNSCLGISSPAVFQGEFDVSNTNTGDGIIVS